MKMSNIVICKDYEHSEIHNHEKVSISDIKKIMQKGSVCFEVLNRKYVKPYFDIDRDDFKTMEDLLKFDYVPMINQYRDAITKSFKNLGYDIHLSRFIKIRNYPYVRDKKTPPKCKFSARLLCDDDFGIDRSDLKQFVIISKKSGMEFIDTNPYKEGDKQQLLGLPYCAKTALDPAIFKYMEEDGDTLCDFKNVKDRVKNWIVQNPTNMVELKIEKEEKKKKKKVKVEVKVDEDEEQPGNKQVELGQLGFVLNNLSMERCDDYGNWIKICFACRTISDEGNIDTLPTLQKWASKSLKYDEDGTEKIFNKGNGSITFGTLLHMLKIDNKEKYREHNEIWGQHWDPIDPSQEILDEMMKLVGKQEDKQEVTFADFTKFVGKKFDDTKTIEVWAAECLAVCVCGARRLIMRKNRKFNEKRDIFEIVYDTIEVNGLSSILDSAILVKNNEEDKAKSKKKGDYKVVIISDLVAEMIRFGKIKTYDKPDFVPYLGENPCNKANVFNMFVGYPFQDMKIDGSLFEKSAMMKHITDQFCNKDQEVIAYFLNWIAHMIQKPRERIDVAIIVYSSSNGTGKNLLFDWLSKVIGERYSLLYSTIDKMFEAFNSEQQDKLLIAIDEIHENDDKVRFSKLKTRITQVKMIINEKFKAPYEVENHSRLLCFTNFPNSIKIDQRRFAAWECSSDITANRNPEYFARIGCNGEMANQNLLASAFHYFANRNIDGFDPTRVPHTEFHNELARYSLSNTILALEQFTQNETKNESYNSNKEVKDSKETDCWVQPSLLYRYYRDYCDNNGQKALGGNNFYQEMKKYKADITFYEDRNRFKYYNVTEQTVERAKNKALGI